LRIDYINSLNKLCKEFEDVYILDGDCSRSTKTSLLENGFFLNAGICEQNMIGMAAGIARNGRKVYINGFASMILQRGYDQIVQSISLPALPVTIVGHYSGFSANFEGAPHHCLLDIAIMGVIPNMDIYLPYDQKDIEYAIRDSFLNKNPTYIRLSRNPIKKLLPTNQLNDSDFNRLFFSSSGDILLVSYGQMVEECLTAIEEYSGELVVGLLSITKLSGEINRIKKYINDFDKIIVVEDHFKIGGLYSRLQNILYKKNNRHLYIKEFMETGDYEYLKENYGLSYLDILKEF